MIREVYRGDNPLQRFIERHKKWSIPPEYIVPDVLDFTIKQPGGIKLSYNGPRNNFIHSVSTSQGQDLDFASLAPGQTTFRIELARELRYHANNEELIIFIPSNLRLLQENPLYAVLHEIGHLWSHQDTDWVTTRREAWQVLCDRTVDRSPREMWLPFDRFRREQEVEAERIYNGEEERRASGFAFYLLTRLRQQGIDLLPDKRNVSSLVAVANTGIESYGRIFETTSGEIKLDYRFSVQDVERIMTGDLPWPGLKAVVDNHLSF